MRRNAAKISHLSVRAAGGWHQLIVHGLVERPHNLERSTLKTPVGRPMRLIGAPLLMAFADLA